METKYTNERNIQMLIYLLKANNIKKIIINPGTANLSFVTSVQSDSFFELYSCVDERSACYMACGLASESNEPVVLTCTGATASRNYMPGLTEAFYRKLPILAVTATSHLVNIGQNAPQMLDRSAQMKDTNKLSVHISPIKSNNDEMRNTILLNKAILELTHNGGGPVHINLETELTRVFSVQELPSFRKMTRYNYNSELPSIDNDKKVGIFVGNHKKWTKDLEEKVDEFCEKYNAVVICDHTSNYLGKYKVQANIICDQERYQTPFNNFDLIIHIGDISGADIKLNMKEAWRVNPDGEIRDTFRKLTNIYEMEEATFFEKYNNMRESISDISFYNSWKKELDEFNKMALECELPFSNLWIARNTISLLPENSVLHLSILNTLRSWNYFPLNKNINCFCNTGGFGIDGIMSTVIGASFNDKEKKYFGVIGDLAFFYDLNSLGNRHIGNNIRIMLINNGCGTEFHNYSHPANIIGDNRISEFVAADAHFGNKSKELVKNIALNLGFEYISAESKEEFSKNIEYFTSENTYEKPIIFEVFTNSKDESDALYKIRTLKTTTSANIKYQIKKYVSPELKAKIKKILRR